MDAGGGVPQEDMQDEMVRTMAELTALRAELGISPAEQGALSSPTQPPPSHAAWTAPDAEVAAAAGGDGGGGSTAAAATASPVSPGNLGAVTIKMLNGQHISVPIDPSGTVWAVKLGIQTKMGWLGSQQRLIFGGRQLEDDMVLLECGVFSGSIL